MSVVAEPQSGETPTGGAAPERLGGHLSSVKLMCTVIAFMAPLAGAAFMGSVIGYGNGTGAVLTMLITGAVFLIFAVGYTTMARYTPNPGAFYAYITTGLGRPWGLGAAFLALFGYFTLGGSTYPFAGTSFNSLLSGPLHGPHVQWWIVVAGLIMLTSLLGYLNIAFSARVLAGLMIVETIIIAIFDFSTLGSGGAKGIPTSIFSWHSFDSGPVGVGILLTSALFLGFEATAIYREEVRDPIKTVPRATYGAVALITLGYAFTMWMMISANGVNHVATIAAADPPAAFFGPLHTQVSAFIADVAMAFLVTSQFGACLATQNICSRYIYNLGIDGVLPAALGKVHRRHKSPYRASMVVTGCSTILFAIFSIVGTTPVKIYVPMAGIGAGAILVLIFLAGIAILRFFRMQRIADVNIWQSVVAPLIAVCGVGAFVFLAIKNYPTLIGGSSTLSTILIIVTFGIVVIGIVYATWLRTARPEVYKRIGRK